MLDKWNVFNKKEYVGVLIYDDVKKSFSFELKNHSPMAIEGYKCLNADKDAEWFKETLFDRVFPPDRIDARELLNAIGLLEYDAWEIIKYVQLSSCNDLIWMTKGTDPEEFYDACVFGEEIKKNEEREKRKNNRKGCIK